MAYSKGIVLPLLLAFSLCFPVGSIAFGLEEPEPAFDSASPANDVEQNDEAQSLDEFVDSNSYGEASSSTDGVSNEAYELESESLAFEAEGLTGGVQTYAADSQGEFKCEIVYDSSICLPNGSLPANKPITFTFNASGGSGNYKYWVGGIGLNYEGGYYFYDADYYYKGQAAGSGGYTTTNTLTYTFVANGSYRIQYGAMDADTNSFYTNKYFYLTISDPSAKTVAEAADALVSDCKSKNYQSEYQKALYLHDRIINSANYDNTLMYAGPAGVLLRGTGTCESFARAYAMVLNRMGIQNGRVEGDGHVWTSVRLDGVWTLVDATWDGSSTHSENEKYLDHLYFGVTDQMMMDVHEGRIGATGYNCTSVERNYFIKSGEISKWSDSIVIAIRNKIEAGETSFSVNAVRSINYNVCRVMNPLVKYVIEQQNWGSRHISVTLNSNNSNPTAATFSITVTGYDNVESFVDRLYRLVLNRQPDMGGFNYHCKSLRNGASGASVALGFFKSSEFTYRGLSNEERVEIAYLTMLDRASDVNGKKYHASRLDVGMSITTVICAFSYSPEFNALCSKWHLNAGRVAVDEPRDISYDITSFVDRLYSKVLGRTPDSSGLNFHCSSLLNGTNAKDVSNTFFASSEYSKNIGNYEKVVIDAYIVMLNRDPDAGGAAYWIRQLKNGLRISELIYGFGSSPEFGGLCQRYGINP